LNVFLPFLDVLVSKKADGILGHQVYRKPTHIDRYLHAETHQHKNSLQSTHLYIELSPLPSLNKEHLQTGLNHLKLALQKNGHDKKSIIKTTNKDANKMISDTQPSERILSIFLYIKETTDQIGRILKTLSELSLNHQKR